MNYVDIPWSAYGRVRTLAEHIRKNIILMQRCTLRWTKTDHVQARDLITRSTKKRSFPRFIARSKEVVIEELHCILIMFPWNMQESQVLVWIIYQNEWQHNLCLAQVIASKIAPFFSCNTLTLTWFRNQGQFVRLCTPCFQRSFLSFQKEVWQVSFELPNSLDFSVVTLWAFGERWGQDGGDAGTWDLDRSLCTLWDE